MGRLPMTTATKDSRTAQLPAWLAPVMGLDRMMTQRMTPAIMTKIPAPKRTVRPIFCLRRIWDFQSIYVGMWVSWGGLEGGGGWEKGEKAYGDGDGDEPDVREDVEEEDDVAV